MNIKVKQTKNLDGHIVTKGKLVLIPCDSNQINNIRTISFKDTYEKPIIISETDQQDSLNKGDSLLFTPSNGDQEIYTFIEDCGYGAGVLDSNSVKHTIAYSKTARILALPEHFSLEILQMIIDGDLIDGQDLWVECEEPRIIARFNSTFEGEYFVKLTDNHINIFPIQQNPQLQKALDIYIKEKHTQKECIGFIDGFNKAQELLK